MGKENNSNQAMKDLTKALGKSMKMKFSLKTILIVVALLVLFVMFVIPRFTRGPGKQNVVSTATLEKVVKTSSLSTYETVYNGVSVIHNEKKPENVDYYVSYEATVKAGLDFNEISIVKDEEAKELVVTLPPITLQEPTVPIEKTDFIIVNKKVNQDALTAEAYKVCINDVKEESQKQQSIYNYAKDNAEKLIKGLIDPFMDQLDGTYELKIEWRES